MDSYFRAVSAGQPIVFEKSSLKFSSFQILVSLCVELQGFSVAGCQFEFETADTGVSATVFQAVQCFLIYPARAFHSRTVVGGEKPFQCPPPPQGPI